MKTISLNFNRWIQTSIVNNRRYNRIYIRGYWTPFVIVTWSFKKAIDLE